MALEQTINPMSLPVTGVGPTPIVPQGLLGNLLGQVGPLLPLAGSPQFQLSSPIAAGIFGQAGSLLPLAAIQQLALQGLLGNPISPIGLNAPGLLPYLTSPQLFPQGLIGNLLGAVGHPLSYPFLGQPVSSLPYLTSPQQWLTPGFGNVWGQMTPSPYLPFTSAFRPI